MIEMSEWPFPPATCALTQSGLHVWRIQLNLDERLVKSLGNALSPDEHARAAHFYFEHDGLKFIAARGALRAILSHYTGTLPAHIAFAYGAQGKPALPGNPVHFNLAHSGDWALCAVALHPVGIDVEDMRRPVEDMDDVARRFFARSESASFLALPAQDKPEAFFRCWTRKEAFIKAVGEGLSHPLDRFEVSFAQEAPAALLRIDGDALAARDWSLLDMPPDAHHAGAVAIRATSPQVTRWTWQMMIA
jgi:4'-phosphopantetheinyl transferase